MAIRNIIKDGDDILLKKSKLVTQIDEKTIQLLEDMKETLKKADGVGLAAVQVGALRRVAIIFDSNAVNPKDRIIELINPEIIHQSGTQRDLEGCLSFPGKYGEVTRPMVVKVKALTRDGKTKTYIGEGLIARAFCHEIDHMDGIVFGERVEKWVNVR
ncbi:MAG: peptide deformylase [Oscillospiraceae bacterium]|nr:peptide deformylase [Oscillospiraceae bacterium]